MMEEQAQTNLLPTVEKLPEQVLNDVLDKNSDEAYEEEEEEENDSLVLRKPEPESGSKKGVVAQPRFRDSNEQVPFSESNEIYGDEDAYSEDNF